MQAIRLGVIGLGEVAQIIHLPILASRPDLFEISAVCDVSPHLIEHVGERYRVPLRTVDVADVLAADVDAVMILASDEYHAEYAVAACRSGKHVFVEKPVCLTLRDAEAIVQARDSAGVQVMVGYMRRYAPAFVEAVHEVQGWDAIGYAVLRDIIGVNRLLIDQTSVVERPNDIPPEQVADRAARAEAMEVEAIGEKPPELRRAYRLLCGLACHDISAMREILGQPDQIAAAKSWQGGNRMHIVFDYGSYVASLDVGVDQQKRFDCFIEVGAEYRNLKVVYNTPYIRHLPTTLVTAKTVGEAYQVSERRPTFTDPYTYELLEFHRVVTQGVQPKTDVEDSIRDLELFREIVKAFES